MRSVSLGQQSSPDIQLGITEQTNVPQKESDHYAKLPEGKFLSCLALYSLLSFHVLKPIKTKRKCSGVWGEGGGDGSRFRL